MALHPRLLLLRSRDPDGTGLLNAIGIGICMHGGVESGVDTQPPAPRGQERVASSLEPAPDQPRTQPSCPEGPAAELSALAERRQWVTPIAGRAENECSKYLILHPPIWRSGGSVMTPLHSAVQVLVQLSYTEIIKIVINFDNLC